MSELWQTVIQLILTPTLIVGVLAFVMRELFKSYLSIDIEKYKTELQSDLEGYKARLKAEYDLKHFEFQTRFSLLHQKKAEAIEQLFTLLAKYQNDLQIWVNWQYANRAENKIEFLRKIENDRNVLGDFFDEKRIYFDDDVKTKVLKIGEKGLSAISSQQYSNDLENISQAQSEKMNEIAKSIVGEIHPLMRELEASFKKILSAELLSSEIEKI